MPAVNTGVRFTSEIPRQTYYTPDGREIKAIPCIHGTNQGTTRDANLDKGWLLQKPQILKPYCPHCDKWHDSLPKVNKCGREKKALQKRFDRQAKQELTSEEINRLNTIKSEQTKEIANLKSDISEIKGMLAKLLEAK